MVDLHVSKNLVIQSHKGPYEVFFDDNPDFSFFKTFDIEQCHFIIDRRVADIYAEKIGFTNHKNCILIDATEENKSIQNIVRIIEQLVANQVKRNHTLVAIGGGVIQDITCFISSVLLRGVPWKYVPTTLLSQADSCIGSKSSVNLGAIKNILGTFNPPKEVFINCNFLDSLDQTEIFSGIGEIIKVHAISGKSSFDQLALDYDRLISDRQVLLKYVKNSLLIKKKFIEQDEFDVGIRNIFNYGHSFGHAIESATNFAIPHGVAVTMGICFANQISFYKGLLPWVEVERMDAILRKNFAKFKLVPISLELFMEALKKDKKNVDSLLKLILPLGESSSIEIVQLEPDAEFVNECLSILMGFRR